MWTNLYQTGHTERIQQNFEMYGPHVDCDMKSSDMKVKLSKQLPDGWVVEGLHTQVKCFLYK